MKAIHVSRNPVSFSKGKWTYEIVEREVRVMVKAEGYAMVRRKGCIPFVVRESELRSVLTQPAEPT